MIREVEVTTCEGGIGKLVIWVGRWSLEGLVVG